MKNVLSRMASLHQAYWGHDRGYRLAWLVGPQCAAVATLLLVLAPGAQRPPQTKEWAKPASAVPAQDDLATCKNASAAAPLRGPACERLIKGGTLSGVALSDAYFGLAYVHEQQGRIDPALSAYNEVLKHNPKSFSALVNRGRLLMLKGDLAGAMRDLDQAIVLNPRDVFAFINRAEVQRRQARLSEALVDANTALSIDANSALARQVREAILADQNRAGVNTGNTPVTAPEPARNTAPTGNDSAACSNGSLEAAARIAACDRVIADRNQTAASTARAGYEKGWLAHLSGDDAKAALVLDDAVRRDPTNYSIVLDRGVIRFALGRFRDSFDDFETASKLKPNAALPYANMGSALQKLGDPRRALELATKASAIDPRLAYAPQVRAEAYTDLKLWAEVVREATEALTLAPGNLRMLGLRADAYFGQSNNALAVADYSDAIRRGERTAAIFNRRGRAYLRQGAAYHDAAVDDFAQAISIDPTASYAYFNRALVSIDRGQDGQAIAELGKAITLNDKDPDYFSRRGQLHLKARNYSDAEADFTRAITLQADNADHWNDRGRTRMTRAKEQKEACAAQTRNDREKGRTPSGLTTLGGSPCSLPVNFDGAFQDFNTAVAKNPTLSHPHYNIGLAYRLIGKPLQALDELAAAHRLNPGNGDALVEMGGIWLDDLKNEREALQKFNDAVALNPRNIDAVANRANILARHPRSRNEAIRDFRVALTINPNYEYAKAGLRKLGVNP